MKTENRDYWITKFTKRVERDDHVTATLEEDGWTVVRLWESDVQANLEEAVVAIVNSVQRGLGHSQER